MGTSNNILSYGEDDLAAAGSAITASYVQIGSKAFPMDEATSVFLHVHWTKGDETSIEIKAQYSNTDGGTESQPTVITTSAATSILGLLEFQTTTTGNHIIPFGSEGRFVKFYIKATGGTPTGTYGASIYLTRE